MKNFDILKTSNYNYTCKDESGNLLICNFVRGSESFAKIHRDNIDKYYQIMESDNIVLDERRKDITELYKSGFLISSNKDELLEIKSMYYNMVVGSSLSLIIMPTENCNFRCKYCYETFEKGKMTRENQDALLRFIQKRITYSPKIDIGWFGGEPLYYSQINI